MTSLIDREETGRLGRAWSKWCRVWSLIDAVGSITIGTIFTLIGLAGIALAVLAMFNGHADARGAASVFVFFVAGGLIGVITGIRDLKKWRRAR